MKVNHSAGVRGSRHEVVAEKDSVGYGECSSIHGLIELTNLGSALAALQADSPELAAKLAELYAVVGKGDYQVDAEALTGYIIRDAGLAA